MTKYKNNCPLKVHEAENGELLKWTSFGAVKDVEVLMVLDRVEGSLDVEGSFPEFRDNAWLGFLNSGYWVLNLYFDKVDNLNPKYNLR